MRLFRFLTFLLLFLVLAAPAWADALPSADDVKKSLTAETITVDNYNLDKNDLAAFYAARDFKPVWNFAGPENAAALNAFLDSIAKAIGWHGLAREDYALDGMRKLAALSDENSRLQLELLVTDTLLRLAHDLHGDDLDLDELYPGWNFHRTDADIPGGLAQALANNDINAFIDGIAPKNPAYGQLAQGLQHYGAMAGWSSIEPGPILRPQDRGARVAQLRARLAAEDYIAAAPPAGKKAEFFDNELRKALADYQAHNGLEADGHLGPKTLEALNVPLAARIDQIRANMERWRHMPEDFPPARAVIVNIPDATIAITEDGKPVYDGPVIVGQVERKTPFIQSVIHSMIINPVWHVPEKIARADILPKLREDPHYLEKQRITIRGNDYDPHGRYIDWQSMSDEDFNFHLRQEPGKMNSLGRLKFDFDNNFAVYLHGTPHQELFRKNERALSSGCVRLRDPELVAQILLKDTSGDWNSTHIEEEIAAKKTHWIEIKNPLPLFIVYDSVFAGTDGRLGFRPDIYGYDRFLIENLKSALEAAEPKQKSEIDPQAL